MAVPEFDQVVEYVTMGPVVHFVLPHQLSLDTLLVLEALREGYEHAAQLGRVLTMAPEEVAALKGAASEVYHQDVVDHEVVSANPAEIVERLIEVRSYPEAHRGAVIREAGEVWFFEGNLYKSITPHTIHDPAWLPGRIGSETLWKRFYEEAAPPWVPPTGAHDAYAKGDRVTFEGNIWESTIDANVWAPGVFGWVQVQ